MWFLVAVTTIINLILIWIMPKRLTRQEIYVTGLGVAFVTVFADLTLEQGLKLYFIIDPDVDLTGTPLEMICAASFGIIFLNFMPNKRLQSWIYTLGWTAFSTMFEWINVYLHYIIYTEWRLSYSAIVYLLGCIYIRWQLNFFRKNI